MTNTCDRCKFFNQMGADMGECRRYPPAAFPTGPGRVTSFWPVVKLDGGCGEWKMHIEIAQDMPPPMRLTQ